MLYYCSASIDCGWLSSLVRGMSNSVHTQAQVLSSELAHTHRKQRWHGVVRQSHSRLRHHVHYTRL